MIPLKYKVAAWCERYCVNYITKGRGVRLIFRAASAIEYRLRRAGSESGRFYL